MGECFGSRSTQRLLRAGPLVVALAILNVSAAALQAAAPVLQKVGRSASAPCDVEVRLQQCVGDKERAVYGAGRLAGRLAALAARGGGVDSEDHEAEEEDGLVPAEAGLAATLKEMFSKLLHVVGTLLGNPGGGGGSRPKTKRRRAMTQGGGFKEAFEAKYGTSHPKFNEKSFSDATEQAWARNRLCLVYIAADGGGGGKAAKVDDAICKALADPKVAAFVDSSFVMWVPGGKTAPQKAAAAAAAAKRVGARSLPFLGVVNSASTTDKMSLERKLARSTVALHHCNPPPSPQQMVSWMTRVLDLKNGLLETELAEQQRLKDEDNIYTERVEGYSKSLQEDALREVREREEEAERVRLEEEEKRAQETREAKEQEDVERRERKASELGEEPPESAAKGDGVGATLMLRLADGSRVRRRFLRSDSMGKVLDWADVQGVDLEAQRLSSSFPKASFSYPADSSLTIEEAGLGRQALLFVEQKPKEAEPKVATETETEAADKGAEDSEDEITPR